MSKGLVIVLGNQLFPWKHYKAYKSDEFLMMETWDLCTHYKYHKHKIIVFLAAMREFAAELKTKKVKIDYRKITDNKKKTFLKLLEEKIKKEKIERVTLYQVEDLFFERDLKKVLKKLKVEVSYKKSPMFLSDDKNWAEYTAKIKKPFMKTFYERERKRLQIMVDTNNKPVGGKWSFDGENRKKAPKDYMEPKKKSFKDSAIVAQVKKDVDKLFSNHVGDCETFWFPVNRKQGLKLLNDFFESRIEMFGPVQDAIDKEIEFGNHSLISTSLNMGLITPDEVVQKVHEIDINKVNISSVEGFLRQVIGWREFVRHIYRSYEKKLYSDNFFNHKNKLNWKVWYGEEKSGIPFLDDAIEKVVKNSYSHHIERLMIFSNIMLLCRVHPMQAYKWFMEMYADSSDWVMAANVFGMGQFSEGGIFATKPYICGSNYYAKMSHYKKSDEWSDAIDGLYWMFIEDNIDFFASNPRMAIMVGSVKKMDKDRKKRIYTAAKKLIKVLTS